MYSFTTTQLEILLSNTIHDFEYTQDRLLTVQKVMERLMQEKERFFSVEFEHGILSQVIDESNEFTEEQYEFMKNKFRGIQK